LLEHTNVLRAHLFFKIHADHSDATGRHGRMPEEIGRHPAKDICEQQRRGQFIPEIRIRGVKSENHSFV